jgi:mannose-6-phosphate isomerase-like protein (cupin superfamily)
MDGLSSQRSAARKELAPDPPAENEIPMKVQDLATALAELQTLADSRGRANKALGAFNEYSLGMGRYTGTSPWERHLNGDELLYVLDGDVTITVLTDGAPLEESLRAGSLFVVPRGLWHQLDAHPAVCILYASPGAEGAERTRDDPRNAPK